MAGEGDAVSRLKEYLRIKSVQPEPDNTGAATWLLDTYVTPLSKHGHVSGRLLELVPNKPIVLMTIEGTDPSLPSLLLNSHMDVVPAEDEHWQHDPWAAEEDEEGWIHGRGIQDMKSVTIQTFEALKLMLDAGERFLRTIHVTVVPDEEIGGVDGMLALLDAEIFPTLNVGLALDEGLASPTEAFTVFYGERAPQWVNIWAEGPVGHGSRFIAGSAVEKLLDVCKQCSEFRAEQEKILVDQHECGKTLGDVTSLNITVLQAGSRHAHNVVPSSAMACLDIRVPPHVTYEEIIALLDKWTAADGVRYDFAQKTEQNKSTAMEGAWWDTFKGSFASQGLAIKAEVFPAATDSRFIRQRGIPAFGFSPMNNTPILLHDHNERLHRDVFLKGVPIMRSLVTDLANVKVA